MKVFSFYDSIELTCYSECGWVAVYDAILVLRPAGVHAAVPGPVVVQRPQEEEGASGQEDSVVAGSGQHLLPVLVPGHLGHRVTVHPTGEGGW